MTKIKAKKKAADWAVFSFLKAAQIWSTRPMRYSPVQADQKKPNWAATRPIWQHGSGGCFRERGLAVLPRPHIYNRFQACCLVLSHKDRHFMELIKWSVADMRYIHFYFGVIKQSIFVFF